MTQGDLEAAVRWAVELAISLGVVSPWRGWLIVIGMVVLFWWLKWRHKQGPPEEPPQSPPIPLDQKPKGPDDWAG